MTDKEILAQLSNMLEPIRNDIRGLKGDVQDLKEDMQDIKTRVKKIELTQENVILPRLQNIEECYVSTYKRYCRNIEEHEEMKRDISILKEVVADHSKILQRIS